MSESGTGSKAPANSGWVDEFLDVHHGMILEGGAPAFEDELVGEAVVRAGESLRVQITRVEAHGQKLATTKPGRLPFLWFLVTGGKARPHSFVVDVESVLEALGKARSHPSVGDRLPVTAYVASNPHLRSVEAGEVRHLTIRVVELERDSGGEGSGPLVGIRFEIAEEIVEGGKQPPLYGFTMRALGAFVALAVPLLEELPQPDGMPGFGRELTAFEYEAGAAMAEEEREEESGGGGSPASA